MDAAYNPSVEPLRVPPVLPLRRLAVVFRFLNDEIAVDLRDSWVEVASKDVNKEEEAEVEDRSCVMGMEELTDVWPSLLKTEPFCFAERKHKPLKKF